MPTTPAESPAGRERDVATLFQVYEPSYVVPDARARALYRAALGLRARREPPRSPHAFLAVHALDGALRAHEVGPSRLSASVLGRHPSCDLLGPPHPTLALRHLLLRGVARGQRGVEVIDLATDHGFSLVGGGTFRRAVVQGPAVLYAAAAPFVLLPAEGDLPPELPPAAFDAGSARASARSWQGDGQLGTLVSMAMSGRGARPNDAPASLGSPVVGRLTLSRDGRSATWDVTQRDLAQGVLLGRYGRCHVNDACAFLTATISRVHLLLIGDDDAVFAYDTASTNGVTADGTPTPCFSAYRGQSVDFVLGHAVACRWAPVSDGR